MDAMNKLNRICDSYRVPRICPKEIDRYIRGNFCTSAVNELFMGGTGRDAQTIEAVTTAFKGDTAEPDKILARVRAGECLKEGGYKLWKKLR